MAGGDLWSSRDIEAKGVDAFTLSARMNAIVGTAITHLTRPGDRRFIGFQVQVNGFFIKAGYHPELAFVDGDVTVGTDQIAETAHGFVNGDGPYQLTTDGTLPAGLELLTDYFVRRVDDNNYTLHTSHTSATKGTTPVDITAAAGGGTHTIAAMPSAEPSATNTDGQEALHVNAGAGAGGDIGGVMAMPERLTVRGDGAASKLVYWFTG